MEVCLLGERGSNVDSFEFQFFSNFELAMVKRDKHILEISSGSKTMTGEFPDTWLADYPGRAGTEKTDALLREMVRRLS